MVARRRAVTAAPVLVVSLACVGALAGVARADEISGRVLAGTRPVADSRVTLYASGAASATRLGTATTNARGRFRIS